MAGARCLLVGVVLMALPAGAQDQAEGVDTSAVPTAAAEATTPLGAIAAGKAQLSLRPRYDYIEQEDKPEHANALTLRTLAGWRTASWTGFESKVVVTNVTQLNEKFDDPGDTRPQYPSAGDAEITDFNELYLRWRGKGADVVAGRQLVSLDRTRFIAMADFRQIQRAFNGVSAHIDGRPRTDLWLAHFERVRLPSGDQQSLRLDVVRVGYEWMGGHKLLGSAYLHDQPDSTPATGFENSSQKILSVRADGRFDLSADVALAYAAERGMQSAYAGSDKRIHAGYLRLSLGPVKGKAFLRIDYEALGSNDGLYGLQTPIGARHPSQGWADQFTTTPRKGIRDRWITAGAASGKLSFHGEIHSFRSDFGGMDFGNEVDLRVAYAVRRNLSVRLDYADYNASPDPLNTRVDVRKLWLILDWAVL